MTKKHVKLLAWMLVGVYIGIRFPMDIYPGWLNFGVQLAGVIAFWVSVINLLIINERGG